MRRSVQDTVYLLSCSVNDIVPDSERLVYMDLDSVYRLSSKHMVSASVAVALNSAGVYEHKFSQMLARAQRKAVIFEKNITQIFNCFETAGIWYMPLKGSILKDLYPKFGMREMADIDILVDKERSMDVKQIMLDLGFSVKSFGINNVDVYNKQPLSNIEIHKSLFGHQHDRKLYDYYSNIKTKLVKDEGNSFGFHFTPEDFYVFMIAHEYKHYISGGTGLRSLLDTYVYLKSYNLNYEYIKQELGKLGVIEFEELNRNMAFALYDGIGEYDSELLEYFIDSGTFGNVDHIVHNSITRSKGGKFSYIFRRAFGFRDGNYWDYLKQRHPTFYKYKIMLPFLPLYRLVYGIIKYPKRIKEEFRVLFKK